MLVVEHDACPDGEARIQERQGTLLGEKIYRSGLSSVAAPPVRYERVAQDVQRNGKQHEVFRQKLPDVG